MTITRLTLFLLFLQQFILAQQFNYTEINTTQGLPSTETYSVIKDKRGYVWFATDHGLARYDGKEFITYNFSDGLSDNTILRMCEDGKGRIWFMSQSNELFYWEDGKICKAPLSKLLISTIAPWDPIFTLYIDSAQNIWFNTFSGIFVSDPQHQYTTLTRHKPFNNRNTSIEIVDNKVALDFKFRGSKRKPGTDVYSYNFAYRVNNTIQYLENLIPAKDVKITKNRNDAVISKDGTIFYSHDAMLFCISKNKKIETIRFDSEIIELTIDENNNLWVGLFKRGLRYFKKADIHSKPISMLSGCTVSDVWADASGAWCTTLEKGVFYIPSLSIYSYSNIPFMDDRIFSINTFRDQMIICTFGERIFETQADTIVPSLFLKKYQLPASKLYTLKEFDNTIYLTWGNHVDILNQSLNKIGPGALYVPGFNASKDVIQSKDGAVWALNSSSIKQLTCKEEHLPLYAVPYRLEAAVVDTGRRFVVGSKHGIYLFENGHITWVYQISPLLKCPISQLKKDAAGNIWIATAGNGLLKFKDNLVTQISIKEGLISNICTSIEIDQSGKIWVGTNKGLSCLYNPKDTKGNWEIKNLTVSNGLNSNEICNLKAFKSTLWVGTKSGLNSIDLSDVFSNGESPTYIQTVFINNKKADSSQLSLKHNQNNVKITLNGLSYSAASEQRYRFRLMGLDTTWQEIKTNEVLFNSLPPGNYLFQAAVINPDGNWSKRIAAYSFVIDKPFWFTWWFLLLELIFIGIIVYLIIAWRTNSIRKKEDEKLRINKLLAEYQMKALTAQMNPHFIFNAINSIQNFIIKNRSTLAYDYLIKFSTLIRMVLNNSKENEISLQQELETLALYVELEQLRFENSFDFEMCVDPKVDTGSIVIPALLLQPYIENAIWHGLMPLEERKGVIKLSINGQDDFLKINITDNGIGRKASDLIKKKIVYKNHKSVGMELTGKRIEVFGQERSFSLQIIDNYDDQGEPCGTSVEIILPMIEIY